MGITRLLLVSGMFVAAVALGVRVPGGGEVYACSGGPDCAAIMPNADLIVEGRILAWEPAPDYERFGMFTPISVTVDVERVFKGEVLPGFAMIDATSLEVRTGERQLRWYGGSGACGSFDEDPTGLYIIAALYRDDRGYYRMNRLANAFLGYEPGGEQYDYAVARLTYEVGPPVTGTVDTRVAASRGPDSYLSLAGGVLAAAGGAVFLVTFPRRRVLPGTRRR